MSKLWFVVAVCLALALATPAFAGSGEVDGAYWRVWKPGQQALVLVRETDSGALISAAIRGLKDGVEYRLIGTNAQGDCSHSVTDSNRLFTAVLLGNGDGTFNILTINVPALDLNDLFYMRLRRVGGTTWACAATRSFTVGPNIADAAFSRLVAQGELQALVLVERRNQGRARVTVTLKRPNDDVIDTIVSLTNRDCGTAGGQLARLTFTDVGPSLFAVRTIDLTQPELNSVRSIRWRGLTGSSDRDWFFCSNGVLIALLVP